MKANSSHILCWYMKIMSICCPLIAEFVSKMRVLFLKGSDFTPPPHSKYPITNQKSEFWYFALTTGSYMFQSVKKRCYEPFVIYRMSRKTNNKILRRWTLFWSFFDLLMTQSSYKHLIKHWFMLNNYYRLKLIKRVFRISKK